MGVEAVEGIVELGRITGLGDYHIVDEALKAVRETDQSELIARLLIASGRFATSRSDFTLGKSRLNEALAVSHSAKYVPGEAESLASLGLESIFEGNSAQAQRQLRRGLALFEQLGDLRGQAYCLGPLGYILLHESEYADYLERAATLFQRVGEVRGTGRTMLGFGDLAMERSSTFRSLKACLSRR